MSDKNELQKREILRMSNEQSNKLTRECLQTALIYLMNDKPFEKITITELVKRSGVSRTAFYRNYQTKEDILDEVAGDIVDSLIESITVAYDSNSISNWYGTFFSIVRSNSKTIKLLIQAGMADRVSNSLNELLKRYYAQTGAGSAYFLDALTGANWSVIMSWFSGGMKETNDFMVNICMTIFNSLTNADAQTLGGDAEM